MADSRDIWGEIEQQRVDKARAAGIVAPAVEPDAMGRAMKVADERGLPPSVVANNLPEYDEEARLDEISTAAAQNPVLSAWLGDADHSAVAKDDVGTLGAIGGVFNRGLLSASKVAPWMPLPQSALDMQKRTDEEMAKGPQMRAADQPGWFSELVGDFEAGWHSGKQGASTVDLMPGMSEDVARGLGYGSSADASAAQRGVLIAEQGRLSERALRRSEATETGFAEIAAAEKTGNTVDIAKAVGTNPRVIMSVVASSLGATAPQLMLSAAMPASRPVAAIVGGAGSFSAEQGFTVLDVMAERGIDTADAGQVTAFLRDKPAMAAAREKALTRGVAVGAFDALTAGFAGRLLANSRRSIASVGSRVAGEGLAQAAGGAAGEATAQLATEGKITSQSDVLLEAAAEVPTFLAEGRGQIAAARRAALNNADKFDAQGEQRSITDLVDLAAQSKTKERAGTRFESLIQSMTDEGTDTVYVPAETLQKLFQSAQDDGALGMLVDPVEFREAMATGGEVSVPLSKYVAALTPEQHGSIADQVRLQPGTRHDLPAVSPEEVQEAITAGLAEATASDERENGPAGQVYDDVFGQLLSKQDEKLARQSASVVQSVYRNLAERTGTDAWALYQQFRINIPGARSEAAPKPRVDLDIDPLLDALRSNKLPTDQDIYGESLVTALHRAGGLRDSGGELANMDAAKARPGLVNNLAGMTLDDALVWAHENGYIAEAPTQMREQFEGDAPDINTLLDMLGKDLAGQTQYRVGGQNTEREKFRADAEALATELEGRGLDVSAMTNEQIREAMQPLNQAAFHGTPHKVDRFTVQKIGTGEGNQSYGWGLYFASEKAVADHYRKQLSIEQRRLFDLADPYKHDSDERAVSQLRHAAKQARFNERNVDAQDYEETARWIENGRPENFGGNIYEVDVPEDSDLLDWDKSIEQQPEKVRQAIDSVIASGALDKDAMREWEAAADDNKTGKKFYTILQQSDNINGAQGASEALNAAGIPGLRYLDGNSRDAGDGSNNYVIWDEAAISEPRSLDEAITDVVQGESGKPESARTRELVDQAIKDNDLAALLTGVAEQPGIDPEQAWLARKLAPIMADIGVRMVAPPNGSTIGGAYDLDANEVWVVQAVPSVVMHELLHAATSALMTSPSARSNASVQRAVAEFNDLLAHVQSFAATADVSDPRLKLLIDSKRGPLSNIKELLTYGMTDRSFQQWLATIPAPVERQEARTAWQAFKDAIAGMLRVPAEFHSALDAVIESTSDLVDFAAANPKAAQLARSNEAARRSTNLLDFAGPERPDLNAGVPAELVQAADAARDRSKAASAAMDQFPKSSMGMTSDEVKNSPEWKAAKREADQSVAAERVANAAVANARKVARSKPTLRQGGDKTPRGSVTFGKDRKGRVFNIELLAGMDASTFMHEMGHVYLEVLNDLAARDTAPKQIADDMATINEWLKREPGAKFTTDQHEQFARGFEAYLREGNAPSSALRRVFASFKVWLTAIYRSALSLNVELTDSVRGVMDRIVASDAEIAEARQEQYQEALITDALAVGMSSAEFDAYNAAVRRAREDAEAVVAAEVLQAMQREQAAWYRQEKRALRAEVLAEIRQQPVYRATRWLRQGLLPDGSVVPEDARIKLSKDDLLDHYGQSFLRNLSGMYAVAGGLRADEAASALGFGSGRELVNALVNAPKLAAAVTAETDARMSHRHPDPMMDGTLPDRAMVAVHRDRQADVMVREIRALEAHTGGSAKASGNVVKGVARAIIAGKKLRQLQPATYRSAEAKAGREAFEAAKSQDWPAALAARRRQLLNFELFREAVRRRNDTVAAAKYLARFQTTKVRARLGKAGESYLDQVDGLLDRFDFAKISDKAAGRRANFRAWVEEQTARGVDLNLPEKLLDEAFSTPYREMTVEDMLAVRDAVKSIDHLARLKGKLMLGNQLRDEAEISEAMAASLRAGWAIRPVTTGDRTNADKVRQAFQQGRVLQGTATDIARELDGFKDGGAIWENTVGIVREAVNNQVNPKLLEAQNALASIYVKHYTKAEIRAFNDKVPLPEVNGDLWSKGRLLSLGLNWGNAGNREAILTQAKAKLSPEQAAKLLGRLDARDWQFIEETWALIDSQWPAIAEAQRRRTGLAPAKVEPSTFVVTTSDGKTLSVPGGYYPLKYEADSIKTMKEEADDFYNSIRTGRTAKAATRNGHTIERVGSGGRSVRLDTGVVQQHLRDVIRDVYLGDAINYVHNTLNGAAFKEALDATGTQEYQRSLEVWLKDAAAGEIGPRVWHERFMRGVRTNFTASVLTFKLSSAMLQVTGILQSSVVLGQANTWVGVAQYLQKPRAMTRYVRNASPYMESRQRTHIEAVQAVMDAEAGRFAAGKATAMRWGYYMIGRIQSLVDVTTWLAAENAGMAKFGGDVEKSRRYADDIVARAQGSGEFMDKSPLQRGTLGDNVRQTEWIKATTALQGYMIAKGNAIYEVTGKTNFKSPRQVMKWAADMTMLLAVEAVIAAAIRGQLPDDEDDDGLIDDMGEFVAKESAANFFGGIPGAATMVTQFRGYDSGGVLANLWGSAARLKEQTMQGEFDKALVKSFVTLTGTAFGLPSSQINRTIDAIAAEQDGADVSPLQYVTGVPKE